MKYSDLLNSIRLRSSTVTDRTIVTESESDRGRVLFSPAFRRLQQKAQVFSMEPNAAVRSRLTHSLEVGQMGRYISDLVGKALKKKGLANDEDCTALVNFVETACLMHDIGNPPFGHFGEAAIQKWFKKYGPDTLEKSISNSKECDAFSKKALSDFYEFDGNPQGLRIVCRLQWNTDEFGLNLTKTTLGSYLKYLRAPGENLENLSIKFTKKAGFFLTEESIVKDLWRHFGYCENKPQRFPLAYIMEASDDIAYCISDLEDSIEKGLLNEEQAFREIWEQWKSVSSSNAGPSQKKIDDLFITATANPSNYTFTNFRTSLNRILVEYAAEQYIANHGDILAGNFGTLIPENSPSGKILETLKKYCKDRVYCHESVQRTELAGYTAISGLLGHFKELLECSPDRFKAAFSSQDKDSRGEKIVTEKKLLSLFPKRYKKVYEHHVCQISQSTHTLVEKEILEWNARAHLVVDFISGMTDDFAMTTFRTLSGMRL